MPDQFTIYRQHADRYDRLNEREDCQQRLLPALAAIRSFDHADIVEWGAGTGWLSALVAPQARSLSACDLNPHMLHVAAVRYRADAAFFWHSDRRERLDARCGQLGSVTFQAKLGSLHDKSERVATLAARSAESIGGDAGLARRAAQLGKCDLLTAMVGEFPELQGLMGRYYAQHDGENAEVAAALEEQYWPRFAGDRVPRTRTGIALSIADKLDTDRGDLLHRAEAQRDARSVRAAACGFRCAADFVGAAGATSAAARWTAGSTTWRRCAGRGGFSATGAPSAASAWAGSARARGSATSGALASMSRREDDMARNGIFGWSLPPGVSARDIVEAAGIGAPCEVCHREVDACVCAECPACGCVGDPGCYDVLARSLPARGELERESGRRGHGMVLSAEQAKRRAEAQAAAIEEGEAHAAAWLESLREEGES